MVREETLIKLQLKNYLVKYQYIRWCKNYSAKTA